MKIRPMIHRRQTMQATFSPIFIQSYTWNRRVSIVKIFSYGYDACIIFFIISPARKACNTLCIKLVTARNEPNACVGIYDRVHHTRSNVLFWLMFTCLAFRIPHTHLWNGSSLTLNDHGLMARIFEIAGVGVAR
uniref:Uncharacterized protein n=2 Tax=Aegilops tauschii subsp. strangulata TaxID=200361 RepID=A0A453Q6U0_AEGTS